MTGKGKYVSCEVAGQTIGIELDRVEEINRIVDSTEVALAPPHVRGLVNLRGSLVCAVNLAKDQLGGNAHFAGLLQRRIQAAVAGYDPQPSVRRKGHDLSRQSRVAPNAILPAFKQPDTFIQRR